MPALKKKAKRDHLSRLALGTEYYISTCGILILLLITYNEGWI